MRRFPVAPALAALAVVTLVLAFIILLPVRAGGGGTGWADLAAFAGFLVLTLTASALFAGALVAARAGWGRLPRPVVALAAVGAAVGALPLVTLASTALASGSVALAGVLAGVLALDVAGLASARGAWARNA